MVSPRCKSRVLIGGEFRYNLLPDMPTMGQMIGVETSVVFGSAEETRLSWRACE